MASIFYAPRALLSLTHAHPSFPHTQVHFTGNKWKKKLYRWHTGYPGGLKERSATQMLERNPVQILRKAVLGMLTRNKLRHGYLEPRLHIYTGATHPHGAQLPDSVPALPKTPRRLRGDFHFGLDYYAHPESYQQGIKVEVAQPEIQMMNLFDAPRKR
jgi:hypothetical protein